MATPRSSRFLTPSAGLLMVALLAACTGLPKVAPSYAVHDFGGPEPVAARSLGFPLRNVEVVVPPWLASTAMQYRLAYAQATRRQAYVESRWAAQPAQLVELALKRAIRTGEAGAGGACRLRVELDEFAQVFDAELATRPWWAGDRFSIADITAFCAIEFVRGLMRWQPGEQGLPNLQAWRDRVAARPSAKAGM